MTSHRQGGLHKNALFVSSAARFIFLFRRNEKEMIVELVNAQRPAAADGYFEVLRWCEEGKFFS